MSAMTPERLQQIKERYADEMIRREHVAELIDTVDHLTAELAHALPDPPTEGELK